MFDIAAELGTPIPPEGKRGFRAGYVNGEPMDLSPLVGLPESMALAETIATLERNKASIEEENAATIDGIARMTETVKECEIAMLLDADGRQELKDDLKRAISMLETAKEMHRGVLDRIALADGEIARRMKMLPAIRAQERQKIIEEVRERERPRLHEFEEAARAALIELMVRKSLDVGGSPGLIDFAKLADRLTIENPMRERAWNRYVELVGVQPM